MNISRRYLYTTCLIAALTLAVACGSERPADSTDATPVAAGLQQINIAVEGMSCAGCAQSITTAVKELPGVKNCEVNVDAGKVQVQYDPATVDQPKIYAAIKSQGYTPVKNI